MKTPRHSFLPRTGDAHEMIPIDTNSGEGTRMWNMIGLAMDTPWIVARALIWCECVCMWMGWSEDLAELPIVCVIIVQYNNIVHARP